MSTELPGIIHYMSYVVRPPAITDNAEYHLHSCAGHARHVGACRPWALYDNAVVRVMADEKLY